ncbi:hypothetical protein P8C59_000887 [Phyllachora maydis]|uniref:Integrase catalytic domain-containing protein n=1 Tax=Phyllachora maydis TaxID=1825666 RepID=A0AAD9M8B2_9PEZI|nr:hypothetical protein P8C59_000887 [Phyllachora maydis]
MADQAKGKASVEDSVSAIKNISSTLAFLTNSSNALAATTGKTSYSPRFDPFSGTIDLDSPLRPPRKEPYLGPAVNLATRNLDPPIDTGSKEGFKDTITSCIVKELSKKAYTIPDDTVLSILLRNSLSSGPRAAISWIYIPSKAFKLLVRQYSRPIKSEKEDVYNEFHALTFSTYRKGLLAFNAEFNGYLAKLTIAKIDIGPSLILNQYFKALESKFPSWRNKIVVEIPSNSIRKEDYRPIIEDAIVSEAIEPNKRYKLRNSPAKSTTLEGIGLSLRGKRPYRPPLTGTRDLPYMLREPVIKGNKVEKAISSPTLKEPNIGQRDYYNLLNLAKLWHVRLGYIGLCLLKKTSSITKGLPNFDKIKEADFHCSSYDRGKAVRRVSKALIPDLPRVLDLIEGDTVKIRPRPYNRNPIVLLLVNYKSRYRWVFNLPNKSGPIVANAIKGFFRGLRNRFGRYPTKFYFNGGTEITDLLTTWLAKRGIKFSTSAPYIHEQNGLVERLCFILEAIVELVNKRYRAIGAKGEAIIPLEKRSKLLKFTSRTEECKLLVVLGSKTYPVYIPSKRAVLKTSIIKFIEDNIVLSQPTNNTALEGELVDLDLDLEGAVSPDPSNLNTKKPLSIEIAPSKLEPYKSSSDSKLDEPLPDKPINPVIVESTRPTISIRKPELSEAFP